MTGGLRVSGTAGILRLSVLRIRRGPGFTALLLLALPVNVLAASPLLPDFPIEQSPSAGTLYLGFIAAVLLFNTLLFVSARDRGYLQCALVAAGVVIAQVATAGGDALHAWGPGIGIVHPVGLALAGVSAAQLTRGFLEHGKHSPGLDFALMTFAVVFAAALIAAVTLPPQYSNAAVLLLIPLFALLAVACGLRSRQLRTPGAPLFLAGWIAILVGIAVHSAAQHGWLTQTAITLQALAAGSAAGILLLSCAQAERTGAGWRERVITQAEALVNSEHMIETLQASEQLLTKGVSQRNLELDTLMMRLQESELRFQQTSHHDPLTGLANQALLRDRLERGIIRAKRHNCRTAAIVIDLDNFTTINADHGREVGDKILVNVALRLCGIVREQDTVARPEGDEFVIILEEVFDDGDLQRVANAAAAEFSHPFRIGEESVMVSASIGYAIATDGSIGAITLLRQAGKLMRSNKEGKRAERNAGPRPGAIAA